MTTAAMRGVLVLEDGTVFGGYRFGHDGDSEGEVIFVSNQGEFMPRNLQTEESRARQMFGIRLRVPSYDGALKAGMTVTAHIPLNGAAPQ